MLSTLRFLENVSNCGHACMLKNLSHDCSEYLSTKVYTNEAGIAVVKCNWNAKEFMHVH